jgi:Right handed beta helix region
VLLIRGAQPAAGTGGPAVQAPQAAPRLSDDCARIARGRKDFAREFAAATAGQTVCLTAGSYGTFYAGRKAGRVGVRAQHGARVTMALEFDSVVNLRLENVTITSAVIQGESRNITIARSRFTGLTLVRAERLEDANIVFDGNRHADIDTCMDGCFQGRLHIDGNTGRPSGVVVKNSVFSGGNSDGVRADADGIKILDNEFYGFRDEDPFHTDPVQIYGGTHVEIRGNYFHDNAVSAQIMMADGGADNVVEDNVIAGTGYTWAITWFSDKGSVIRHNTFADGRCSDNIRCGMINLGAKANDPAGRGTVIRNNVMGGISNGGEGKNSRFAADHNLTTVRTPGARNAIGIPKFRGPLGKYAGYRLAAGSPGVRGASNGSDRGIR